MKIIVELDKMKELLLQFYTLTKIRTVIYDDEFNKILSVPDDECRFCRTLRENGAFNELCVQNDTAAREVCAATSKTYTYVCHCGLYESISPIKMNGMILGYMMLGQIIEKSEKRERKASVLAYGRQYSEAEALDGFYDKLSTKSSSQIDASIKIMESCICYLWANQLIDINENCLSAMVARHISENLTGDLSVRALCREFGISKNKLYALAFDNFGTSIASYVRTRRLQNAAALLKQGATVAEASVLSGINDFNYFSGIFKKQFGVLPSKYARLNSSLNK